MISEKIAMEREKSYHIRQKVLELLSGNDEEFTCSSNELSRQLQFPVPEIRKAITELRKDDYGIIGKPLSGYYLEWFPDRLEEGLIRYEYLEPWYTFSQRQCPTPLPDFSCFASEDAADSYLAENRSVLPNGAFAVADGALANDDYQTEFAHSAYSVLVHHRLVHLAFLLKEEPPCGKEKFLFMLTERIFQKIKDASEIMWDEICLEWKISGNQIFYRGKLVVTIAAKRLAPDAILIRIDAGLNHITAKYNFMRSRLAAYLIQCCLDEMITEKPCL